MKTRVALATVLLLSLGLYISRAQSAAHEEPQVQVIEMTARKYEFNPAEIRVKKGTRVQLKVRALDRTHGLKFNLYPEGVKDDGQPGLRFTGGENKFKLEKEQVQVVEFIADRPGTYEFACSVFCGFGHGRMEGKLIVEE